jgi:hypothetical protein
MITYGRARTRAEIREAKKAFVNTAYFCENVVNQESTISAKGDREYVLAFDDDKIIAVCILRRTDHENYNPNPEVADFEWEIITYGSDPEYDQVALYYNMMQAVVEHVMGPGVTWFTSIEDGPMVGYTLTFPWADSAVPLGSSNFVRISGTTVEPNPYLEVSRVT